MTDYQGRQWGGATIPTADRDELDNSASDALDDGEGFYIPPEFAVDRMADTGAVDSSIDDDDLGECGGEPDDMESV